MRKFIAKFLAPVMTVAMIISQPGVVQASETLDNSQTEEAVIFGETEIFEEEANEEISEEITEKEAESEENIEEEKEDTSKASEEEELVEVISEDEPDQKNEEDVIDENLTEDEEDVIDENSTEDEEDVIFSEEELVGEKYISFIGVDETSEIASLSSESAASIMSANNFEVVALSTKQLAEKSLYNTEAVESLVSAVAGTDYEENEVVFFADSREEAEKVAECYGGTITSVAEGLATMTIPCTVKDAVKVSANANISIPAVFPQYKYAICDEPASVNDPYYSGQDFHEEIEDTNAWGTSKGEGVKVYIIDTGVDATHEDLINNVKMNRSSIINPETEDFYPDGQDDHGHGTHCAGLVAAQADNGIGVAGVAPEAEIYSIKAMDKYGHGSTAEITRALSMAIGEDGDYSNCADIISMSLGSYIYDAVEKNIIQKAVKKGIIVIAAAGNENTSQKHYPGAYDNVICVGAVEYTDGWTLAYFSNYGEWVDVYAPGVDILSTVTTTVGVDSFGNPVRTYEAYNEDSAYTRMSGTSMSTPIVAGVAALIKASSDIEDTNDAKYVEKINNILVGSYDQALWGPTDKCIGIVNAGYAVSNGNTVEVAKPFITFTKAQPDEKNKVATYVNENGDDVPNLIQLSSETPYAKIVFTTNGSKPKASNLDSGEIEFGTNGYINPYKYGSITYLSNSNFHGKVKIRAIAVLGDKVSKEFTATYNFYTPVMSISTYSNTLKAGSTIPVHYTVYPDFATNRKVSFSVTEGKEYASVSKKGKLKVKKTAPEGTKISVCIKSSDGSGVSQTADYYVKNEFNSKIVFHAPELLLTQENTGHSLNYNLETEYKIYALYEELLKSGKITEEIVEELSWNSYRGFWNQVSDEDGVFVDAKYKSSNSKVASVTGEGYILAKGRGTATITAIAQDGSGRKTTCVVRVVDPQEFDLKTSNDFYCCKQYNYYDEETGTNIYGEDDNFQFNPDKVRDITWDSYNYYPNKSVAIGSGCSLKIYPETEEYNEAKNTYVYKKINFKKLKWSVSDTRVKLKNGKITVPKTMAPGEEFTVTAQSKDEFGFSLTMKFKVYDAIKSISYKNTKNKKTITMRVGDLQYSVFASMKVNTQGGTEEYFDSFEETVSESDSAYIYQNLFIRACKKGTYKQVIQARDGSCKKFTLTVKVK